MALPKGTIRDVLDSFFGNQSYRSAISRALKEFRSAETPEEVAASMSELEMGQFNEWLVFDFVLKNGKTVLQDFIDRNRHDLGEERLQIFQDLLDTNSYGLFEVTAVRLGQGLDLTDLVSGRRYAVNDFLSTFNVHKGSILFNRVAKVSGLWQLVGADSEFPSRPALKSTLRHLHSIKGKISPKDRWQYENRRTEK